MSDQAAVRDDSAAGAPGPDQHRLLVFVPGGHGTAFVAKAGELIEIVDVEGQQVADFVAFAEQDRTAWLSTTHTRSALLRLTVRPGDLLESNWRHPMFELIRDDVGRNDIITSMCDDRRYLPDELHRGAAAVGNRGVADSRPVQLLPERAHPPRPQVRQRDPDRPAR